MYRTQRDNAAAGAVGNPRLLQKKTPQKQSPQLIRPPLKQQGLAQSPQPLLLPVSMQMKWHEQLQRGNGVTDAEHLIVQNELMRNKTEVMKMWSVEAMVRTWLRGITLFPTCSVWVTKILGFYPPSLAFIDTV